MSLSLKDLLQKLSKVKKAHTGGYVACCPAHDDHSPSLSVDETLDGRLLVYCYAGCSFDAICAALHLQPQDLRPAPTQRTCYEIRDPRGHLISSHVRQDSPEGKKVFWDPPLKPMGLSVREMPFYRSQDIPSFDAARWVYLCEGEKCCDLLRNHFGCQALATVTGATSQHNAAVFSSLKGLRVAIWPDNDAVGLQHMRNAYTLAETAGAVEVALLDPKGLGLTQEGDDAEQWIESQRASHTPKQLAELLERGQLPRLTLKENTLSEEAPPEEPLVSFASLLPVSLLLLEKRATGEDKPIPLPFPHVAPSFGGGLWAGAHYLIGATGSGKTQIALEFAKHAATEGYPVLYIALELGELDLISRLITPPSYRWSDTFLGRLPSDAWSGVFRTATRLQPRPLYFEFGDPMGWPYSRLLRSVERLRKKHPDGPVLVVLDFLQLVGDESLINPRARQLEPRARVGNAAYLARKCAQNYGASMLLLSSTARSNYAQLAPNDLPDGLEANGRVTLPHLFVGTAKESGDVEFSGDTVTTIVRAPLSENKERYLLVTAKSRYGAPRWAELHFNGSNFSVPTPGVSLDEALRARDHTPLSYPTQTPDDIDYDF